MLVRLLPALGPLPPHIRSLLLGQLWMNTSHFMAVPLLAVYVAHGLGLGPAALGSVMAANMVCAQALPLLAGPLADRCGAQRAMVLGLCLRGIGLAGFASQSQPWPLVASACLGGTGVALYESALFGALGRAPKALLPAVFAANNQMLNLGVVAGPLLAAAVVALAGPAGTLLCFALSAAVFLALAWRLWMQPPTTAQGAARTGAWARVRSACGNRDFRRLVLAAMPWYFLFPQLYVAFPIYLDSVDKTVPGSMVFVVNGVVGVAFMALARRWLTHTEPHRLLCPAYGALALLFASMVPSSSLLWFLLFIAGYTLVETTILPAIEVLTSTLAGEDNQSTCFGLLSAAGALAGGAGYYAGSWLALRGNGYAAWTVFGLVAGVGWLLALAFQRRMPARTPDAQAL